MDYCIACHRHLNGALACAGCGTPAEHLIPAAPPRPAAASPAGSGPAALADVYADSLVVLSGAGRPGRAGERGRAGDRGRADARRRTTHRRRRRTALTIGFGFLLAVATMLGLARMGMDGERTDRASTVVLTDDAGPEQPAPLPGLTDAPAAPSAVPSGRATASAAAKATAGGTKQAGPGRTAGGTGAPGPAGPASAPGGAGPTRSAAGTGGAVQPTQSGPAAPGSSGAATPGGATSAAPVPSPGPVKPPACPWWNLLCW
ncbi:SCO2400 family protein [Streptomyces sp. NPDC054961]